MSNERFPWRATPSWLQKKVDTAVHESGVWGVFVDGKKLDGDFPSTSQWLVVLINQVCRSFPWASIRAAEIGLSSGMLDWQETATPLDEWLSHKLKGQVTCGGLKANLELELFWVGYNSTRGKSIFLNSGRILVDPNPMAQPVSSEVFCSLILSINLFSNWIWCEERSCLVDLQEAASKNREMLAQSLHDWETISGGEIREWESSMITGIQRYGFTQDCTEL